MEIKLKLNKWWNEQKETKFLNETETHLTWEHFVSLASIYVLQALVNCHRWHWSDLLGDMDDGDDDECNDEVDGELDDEGDEDGVDGDEEEV